MKSKPSPTLIALIAARTLISDVNEWTRKTLARCEDGVAINPENERATCWCANGAILAVAPTRKVEADARQALFAAALDLYKLCAPTVNDYFGHGHVLHVFDAAIAKTP